MNQISEIKEECVEQQKMCLNILPTCTRVGAKSPVKARMSGNKTRACTDPSSTLSM
jgi:hypothetical protein